MRSRAWAGPVHGRYCYGSRSRQPCRFPNEGGDLTFKRPVVTGVPFASSVDFSLCDPKVLNRAGCV